MIPIYKWLFLISTVACISACVSATPLLTSEGKTRFFIDCGRQGTAKCIEKANEVCPNGYSIDGQDQRTGWSFNRYGGGTVSATTMTVTCK
jgi:hypothetical protein